MEHQPFILIPQKSVLSDLFLSSASKVNKYGGCFYRLLQEKIDINKTVGFPTVLNTPVSMLTFIS